MALVVVIEDEQDILELLEYHLQKQGYDVFASLSTSPVEKLIQEEMPDLMIVDRNLPNIEGSEFVLSLRKKGIDIPVIYLTAKSSESDIDEGFLRGADDYVTKPFNYRELMHRVKAVLNRYKPQTKDIIKYRDLEIHPKSREVYIEGKRVDLTKLEYDLLMEFYNNLNIALSRDYLLDRVWNNPTEYQPKTVNVAINRLKEKIDPTKDKNYIISVRGIGYKMV